MLRLAFFFLLLAAIAGLLGFTTIAGASFGIAKFLFFVFLIVWIVLLALGAMALKRLKNAADD